MKFQPEVLQKIKASVNLIEVVGEHVVLRKAGSNYVGLCPFHNERTPSFSVSETKQLYHCYGCQAGGDLISFVMENGGMSFGEAIQELAQRAGVPLPSDFIRTGSGGAGVPGHSVGYRLNRFVAAYYREYLARDSRALEYLKVRGISTETSQVFYLGSSPEQWSRLYEFLKKKKAPIDWAERAGLIRKSNREGYFDLFRNRILFPILNAQGKVIGFGGRLLPGEGAGSSGAGTSSEGSAPAPKYLNSPDSALYQKSRALFGLYQAKKFIREKDEVVLVEGFFDVLAMFQAGFQNVVATCGTALTSEHLETLLRLTRRIVILFDRDAAGVQATERAMEAGIRKGVVLYGAELQSEKDPADLLVQEGGVGRLKEILSKPVPLLDQKIEELLRAAEAGPEAKSQSIKKIGVWLRSFDDPVGRELREDVVAKRLQISKQLLLKAQASVSDSRTKRPPEARSRKQPEPHREHQSRHTKKQTRVIGQTDRVILGAVFYLGESWVREVLGELPPGTQMSDFFEHPVLRKWMEFIHGRWGQDPGLFRFFEAFQKEPSRFPEAFGVPIQGEQEALKRAKNQVNTSLRGVLYPLLLEGKFPFEEKDLEVARGRIRLQVWARFSHQLKGELAEAEASEDVSQQAKLMKDYLDVQRKLKEFSTFYDKT